MNMTIRELRDTTGLSQSKFTALFHIPVSTLQDWEHGRRKPPEYVVFMISELLKNGFESNNSQKGE